MYTLTFQRRFPQQASSLVVTFIEESFCNGNDTLPHSQPAIWNEEASMEHLENNFNLQAMNALVWQTSGGNNIPESGNTETVPDLRDREGLLQSCLLGSWM